ncbi:DUF4199 domain-containing protein [Wenyingzhuangia sp. chi5]|uniref:DUF4199 domain-containing protein n=1 Tax=Wenyingzhuangia gilva TaxID=3057677 RepID=A0ABT8VN58_9FLAO|nr:DUF4199 domain-containing protein [Wenyingzhuangia sp. chi5]MDO3693390.1 DUF4199 domain-containing protein [Wenyingzhuangia sp. chi5]
MKNYIKTNPILFISIIAGFAFCLNEHIPYLLYNKNPFLAGYTNIQLYIRFVIPIIFTALGIIVGQKQKKFIDFKSIIKVGLSIALIISLTYTLYMLLFIFSIEPNTLEEYKQGVITLNTNTPNMSVNEINQKAEDSKNNLIITGVLFTFASNLFIGFITAVVTAIFVRNK